MKELTSAIGLLALSGMIAGAAAQSGTNDSRIHIEAMGIGSVLGGQDFETAGVGFGGQVFVGPRFGNIVILATGSYRGYEIDVVSDRIDFWGIGLTPRYAFPATGALKPWVGLNGDIMFEMIDILNAINPTATGFELGGSAGIGLQITNGIRLNTMAEFGYLSFGNVSVNDVETPDSGTNGWGFTFGFGVVILP